MKFSELYDRISAKCAVLSNRIIKDVNIYYTENGENASEPAEDALLWSDDLCSMNSELLKMPLLWSGRKPESLDLLCYCWIEVAPQDLSAAVGIADELLRHEYKAQSLKLRMTETIMYGKGIGAVVDSMAKELNTNITIIDMSGKIITHSHPFTLDDPLWAESITRGFCPPFFIKHLHDVREQYKDTETAGPILRHCEDNQLYYLASRIHIGGELYGYVFMLQRQNSFSPYCEDVLSYISYAATEIIMKKDNMDNVRSGFYDNLLIDIIRGISADQINARILASGMKFPANMCLAAVKPRYFQGDNYIQGDLARTLKQMFPKERLVYYRKMMLIVFGLDSDAPGISAESLGKLVTLCEQEHLVCGVSNPFTKIKSLRHYYEQAIKSIELASRLDLHGDVHEYKNLALYDLINNEAQERKLGFYCHPALGQLAEFDRANGSLLHDTLACLAKNGFNSSAAAAELFLHRNTLSYRKQRISAITGLDLDSFDTQFMLKYSYMIEEYLNKHSGTNL